jgi:hypothetical protein
LSLIGWGNSRFWIEMALDSLLECLCIQTGRTVRRTLVANVCALELAAPRACRWTVVLSIVFPDASIERIFMVNIR